MSDHFRSSEDVLTLSFQSGRVYIIHCSMLCLFHNGILGLNSPHKVGRMMMNIRGLVLDDPGHTVRLQTLDFATFGSQTALGLGSEHEMAPYEAGNSI